MNDVNVLMKEFPESALSFLPCEDTVRRQKDTVSQGDLTRHWFCLQLDLSQSSRIGKNKVILVI